MKVLYVEYIYAGSLFSDTGSKVTTSKDVNLAKSQLPSGAFGFRFYEQEEQVVDGEALKGKPKNHTGWYYVGEKLSLEDVKRNHSDKRILISNMEMNDYANVVFTKFGQFIPVSKNDVVL